MLDSCRQHPGEVVTDHEHYKCIQEAVKTAEQRPQLRRAPVFHPDRLPYKTLLSFFRIWRKLYLFSPVQVCISRQFVVDYSESYASADAITHI